VVSPQWCEQLAHVTTGYSVQFWDFYMCHMGVVRNKVGGSLTIYYDFINNYRKGSFPFWPPCVYTATAYITVLLAWLW